MGTVVTIEVIRSASGLEDAVETALGWFQEVEERCSRFRTDSELMRACGRTGKPVQLSPLLFEAVRFALDVAEESGGAFDPTVGRGMQQLGIDKEHTSGKVVRSGSPVAGVSYRDVELDHDKGTMRLHQPMTLDLGAVAKGLAVDMATRELLPFRNFSIDAGGDLYLGGRNHEGRPWSVGIRHPRQDGGIIDSLEVSNTAVCTSGDYERGQHILDPRTGKPADCAASVTVVAEGAMLADALATAAFVMGPQEAIPFLERMGVEALYITPDLKGYETGGLRSAA